MKKFTTSIAVGLFVLGLVAPCVRAGITADMKEGKPEFKAMSQLAFGPEGVLFIAGAKAAAILAVATGDTKPATSTASIKAEAINQKIAALAGTSVDQIIIEALAVNPISRQAYLAASRAMERGANCGSHSRKFFASARRIARRRIRGAGELELPPRARARRSPWSSTSRWTRRSPCV